MSNVLEFPGRQEPHMSGEARCAACQHVEIVVAPVGVTWMECSSCHAMKSRFTHPALKLEDGYTCNCGCDVFRITRTSTYCINCGISHVF